LVLCSLFHAQLNAQNQFIDTISVNYSHSGQDPTSGYSIQSQTKSLYRKEPDYKFNYNQLILPTSLTVFGWFGVYNGFIRHIDNEVVSCMESIRGDCYFHADDYLQYLPIVGYIGLDSMGVNGKISFKERLIVGLSAYASLGILTNTLKYTVKEPRPDTSAKNSFPSGHTATAFMGAELIRIEYGTWPAISAYTIASTVAFFRLYNNRHWLNDVVAGAGIGILSARIGYWLLPLWRNLFHWDKSNTYFTIMPSYNSVTKSYGIGTVVLF